MDKGGRGNYGKEEQNINQNRLSHTKLHFLLGSGFSSGAVGSPRVTLAKSFDSVNGEEGEDG